MTSRTIPAATALALAAALTPATAASAADLPANSRDGVTLAASKKAAAFTFSPAAAKAYRSIAGRTVEVTCSRLESLPLGLSVDTDRTVKLRAPKRGRVLRAKALVRGTDFCTVFSTERVRREGGKISVELAEPVVSVPLTQQGATYVEEGSVAADLAIVSNAAALYAKKHKNRLPTFAQLNAVFSQFTPEFSIAPLANAAAAPPVGKVGYFTDGTTVTTVGAARTGRRLYYETGPDNRLSTNVANYLFAGD